MWNDAGPIIKALHIRKDFRSRLLVRQVLDLSKAGLRSRPSRPTSYTNRPARALIANQHDRVTLCRPSL